MSVIISNSLILLGAILFAIGISYLVKLKVKKQNIIGLIVIHLSLFLYFTYINTNIMARILVISAELALVYGFASWLFFKDNQRRPHVVRFFVGWIYLLNALFYIFRIIFTIIDGPQGGLFTGVYYLSLTLIVTMVFLVSRTVGVLMCVMISFDEELQSANKILSELSTTDHLTKVKNLRSLMRLLERELELVKRYERSFSVAMIDLDHFKSVNDTYGHTVGDEVLVGVAKILKQELRKVDVLGRYGGEEFLLILPESTCEESAKLLMRIQEEVRKHEWYVDNLTVTFSAGVFEVNSTNCHADTKEIIKQADDLMYIAKKNGRDRVEHLCTGL